MSELKVPLTVKIMYVCAVLIGILGVLFDDDISIVISVLALIVISCSISILEGIHKGFRSLAESEVSITELKASNKLESKE